MQKYLFIIPFLLLAWPNINAQSKLDPNIRSAKIALSKFKQNHDDFKSLDLCLHSLELAEVDTSNLRNHVYWTTKAEVLSLISELWNAARLYQTGDSTNFPKLNNPALEANFCLTEAMNFAESTSTMKTVSSQFQENIINLYNEALCNMNIGDSLAAYHNFIAIGNGVDALKQHKIDVYPQNQQLQNASYYFAATNLNPKKENAEYCRLLGIAYHIETPSEELFRNLCLCENISSDSLLALQSTATKQFPNLKSDFDEAFLYVALEELRVDNLTLEIVHDYLVSNSDNYELMLISGLIFELKAIQSLNVGLKDESKVYFMLAQEKLHQAVMDEVVSANWELGIFYSRAANQFPEFIDIEDARKLSLRYFELAEIANPNDAFVLSQLYQLFELEGNKKMMAEFSKRLANIESSVNNTSYFRK